MSEQISTREKRIFGNVEQIMFVNNIERIKSIDEINELYDVQLLIEKNLLQTKYALLPYTIIMFDTNDFNSSYLMEQFHFFKNHLESSEGLSNLSEISKIEMINKLTLMMKKFNVKYCDDMEIYTKLFSKFFHTDSFEVIRPVILFIDHSKNEILIEQENLLPMNESNFIKLYYSVS